MMGADAAYICTQVQRRQMCSDVLVITRVHGRVERARDPGGSQSCTGCEWVVGIAFLSLNLFHAKLSQKNDNGGKDRRPIARANDLCCFLISFSGPRS